MDFEKKALEAMESLRSLSQRLRPEQVLAQALREAGPRPDPLRSFKPAPHGMVVYASHGAAVMRLAMVMLGIALFTVGMFYYLLKDQPVAEFAPEARIFLWAAVGGMVGIELLFALHLLLYRHEVLIDRAMTRLIVFKRFFFLSRRTEIIRGQVKSVLLSARRPRRKGYTLDTFYWVMALELGDGRTVPAGSSFYNAASVGAEAAQALKEKAAQAWTLAQLLNVPLEYRGFGMDMSIRSLDDLPEPAEVEQVAQAAALQARKASGRSSSTGIVLAIVIAAVAVIAAAFLLTEMGGDIVDPMPAEAPIMLSRTGLDGKAYMIPERLTGEFERYIECRNLYMNGTRDHETLYCLALNTWKLGWYDQSYEYWTGVNDLNPDPEDHENFCKSLVDVGRPDIALECRRRQLGTVGPGSDEAQRIKDIIQTLESGP